MKALIATAMAACIAVAGSAHAQNTQIAAVAQMNATKALECTQGPGMFIRGNGADLLMLPGGTAELYRGTSCHVLGFVGISQGKAVYTDDGHGLRYNTGLVVMTDGNKSMTVTHVSGTMVTYENQGEKK